MIQKIVDVNNPSLRKVSKKVVHFDRKLSGLISDMKQTLKAQNDPEGVGLAAPQIGKNLQVFLINYNKTEKIVINPKIISISKEDEKKTTKNDILEGCLSLPHYYGPIIRKKEITIEYQNQHGEKITETFKGFLAHIVQHEIDHLQGILFIDHILKNDSPLYKFDGDEWEEVTLK